MNVLNASVKYKNEAGVNLFNTFTIEANPDLPAVLDSLWYFNII